MIDSAILWIFYIFFYTFWVYLHFLILHKRIEIRSLEIILAKFETYLKMYMKATRHLLET